MPRPREWEGRRGPAHEGRSQRVGAAGTEQPRCKRRAAEDLGPRALAPTNPVSERPTVQRSPSHRMTRATPIGPPLKRERATVTTKRDEGAIPVPRQPGNARQTPGRPPHVEQAHPHPVGRRVLLNPIDDNVHQTDKPSGEQSVFANSLNYATTPLVVLKAPHETPPVIPFLQPPLSRPFLCSQ